MRAQESWSDQGLGLIEIVIGMFLLAIISIAILPSLWQGVRYSSEQSAAATATRELNAIVEQIRDNPTCPNIVALTAARDFTDGVGRTLQSTGAPTACPSSTKTVTVTLTATDESGSILARVSAIVYVP